MYILHPGDYLFSMNVMSGLYPIAWYRYHVIIIICFPSMIEMGYVHIKVVSCFPINNDRLTPYYIMVINCFPSIM